LERYALYYKLLKKHEDTIRELYADDDSAEWTMDHFYMYMLLKGNVVDKYYADQQTELKDILNKFTPNHMLLVSIEQGTLNMFINDQNSIVEILGMDMMVNKTHLVMWVSCS
jgi:hypothetical protein